MEYGALIGLVTEDLRSPRSNTVFELVNDVSAALKADMVRRSQTPSSRSRPGLPAAPRLLCSGHNPPSSAARSRGGAAIDAACGIAWAKRRASLWPKAAPFYPRGPQRMTAAPIRHMEAPVMSQRSGRAFSTIQSQRSDATM